MIIHITKVIASSFEFGVKVKGKRGGVLTNGHVLYLKSDSGGKGYIQV